MCVDLVTIVAHPNVACLSSFGWIAGVGGAPSGVSSGTGIMRGCKAAQHRGAWVTSLSIVAVLGPRADKLRTNGSEEAAVSPIALRTRTPSGSVPAQLKLGVRDE